MEDKMQFRFFTVVTPSCIQHQCLVIPDKVTRDFGKKLSSSVLLKVPTGKEWRLELRKEEGKLYFHKSWDDFMKYHSVHVGEFLVFQYHGNSIFEMAIFDISGLEIEYPCHTMVEPDFSPSLNAKSKKRKFDNIRKRGKLLSDREDDVVELDENSYIDLTCSDGQVPKPTTAKFSHESMQSMNNIDSNQELNPCVPCKERSLGFISDCQPADIAQESCDVFGSIFRRIDQNKAPAIDSEKVDQERISSVTGHGVVKSAEIDLPINSESEDWTFTSKYPFCTVYIHPFYVHRPFLTIPCVFGRKYLQGVEEVTLRVSDGKTWKVGCSSLKDKFLLIKNWRAFVVDNHLEEGDACVFELVDRNQMEFRVSIFRVGSKPFPIRAKHQTSNVSKTGNYVISSQNKRRIEVATSFSSEKPFCAVNIGQTYLYSKYDMWMPTNFARKYLKDGFKGITLRNVDGGTWPVQCKAGEPCNMRKGWKAFALDNHLKVGDVCVFELSDDINMELKVFIFSST